MDMAHASVTSTPGGRKNCGRICAAGLTAWASRAWLVRESLSWADRHHPTRGLRPRRDQTATNKARLYGGRRGLRLRAAAGFVDGASDSGERFRQVEMIRQLG
jgi:hypothetical protein